MSKIYLKYYLNIFTINNNYIINCLNKLNVIKLYNDYFLLIYLKFNKIALKIEIYVFFLNNRILRFKLFVTLKFEYNNILNIWSF